MRVYGQGEAERHEDEDRQENNSTQAEVRVDEVIREERRKRQRKKEVKDRQVETVISLLPD